MAGASAHGAGAAGEPGETTEAEQWYRKAADHDDTGAMSNLGVLLENRGETAEAEQKAVARIKYPDSST